MPEIKNKSEIPDGYKPYVCGNRRYWLPPDNCVFCEHCTDIFWDYTHGMYTYFCELDYNNEKMTCGFFKEEKE